MLKPIMFRPEFRTTNSREPTMKLPNLAIAPPEIGIPPKTRAIRIWVSNWLPPEEVTEPFLIERMNAAKPVIAPDNT